ncbi:hypothetical protein IKE67_02475 [bacterium]|nr:hypothetical protein [bacterium]
MRNIVILIFILMFINWLSEDTSLDNIALKNVEMKPFAVPIQEELTPEEKKLQFTEEFFAGKSTIKPLYRYKIYARIYSKKKYLLGIDPNPAPYDLALGWDGLEKDEVFKTILAWQSFRWVHWRLKPSCPYDVDGVYLRLANNHVIPANKKILKGIKKLKKKDTVYMEGYLVSYYTESAGRTGSGASSTSRTDRLDNSCEVIYVTRLVSKYGEYK